MRNRRLPRLACAAAALCFALGGAPAASAFSDVPGDYWAAPDIALCTERGFFDAGDDSVPFGVGAPMRRDVFMEVLCRFFGWTGGDSAVLPYRDVAPGDWYAASVAAAYERGVFVSQAETFRPDEAVTREELAAMLVRALGYRSIAGLAETLPFPDVTTNAGYIAMAYHMGIMNGTQGSFLPAAPATRAQTAAVLSRLYRKLNGPAPERIAVVSAPEDLAAGPLDTAAASGLALTGDADAPIRYLADAAAVRDAARAAGIRVLLYVDGRAAGTLADAVSMLAEAAWAYDGLYLELGGTVDPEPLRLLRSALAGRALYLSVPDPRTGGVPYEALAEAADVLTVRVDAADPRMVEDFPSDPVEPLEEVYDALRILTSRVDPSKLALTLTTSGRSWLGGAPAGTLTGRETAALRSREDVQVYFSERYGCAYLRLDTPDGEQVVWYLDEDAAAARVRLMRLFSVGRVVLTDAPGMMEGMWTALR